MSPITQSYRTAVSAKIWIPSQPGAWFMALGPALAGVTIGGISWRAIWLFLAWLLCYCFQFTAARYLAALHHCNARAVSDNVTSRIHTVWHPLPSHDTDDVHTAQIGARLHTFAMPALTYLALTALVGIPLIALVPRLLVWAVPLLALAALSFLAAYSRKERTLWGNAVSVVCSSLICLVATSMGSRYYPSLLPRAGIAAALAFAATLYSSVLFVKTMIRNRGQREFYAFSVAYHMAITAIGFIVRRVWGMAALVLLICAVVLPLIDRGRIKILYVGLVEVATSMMCWTVIVLPLI